MHTIASASSFHEKVLEKRTVAHSGYCFVLRASSSLAAAYVYQIVNPEGLPLEAEDT